MEQTGLSDGKKNHENVRGLSGSKKGNSEGGDGGAEQERDVKRIEANMEAHYNENKVPPRSKKRNQALGPKYI